MIVSRSGHAVRETFGKGTSTHIDTSTRGYKLRAVKNNAKILVRAIQMTKNLSIHATQGMQELEKQQINDWLSDWLVEAEAASAAREVPRTHTHTHTRVATRVVTRFF